MNIQLLYISEYNTGVTTNESITETARDPITAMTNGSSISVQGPADGTVMAHEIYYQDAILGNTRKYICCVSVAESRSVKGGSLQYKRGR